MKRRIAIAAAIVIAIPLALVVAMRAMRSRYNPPVAVHGRLFRLRNLFTEIYGARVGDKVILFDAGIDNEGPALDALLGALHAVRDDVSDVFLTHGHFDHVAASPLCTRARIHVGRADLDILARRAPYEPAAPRWLARVLPVGPIVADSPYDGRQELPLADGSKVLAVPLPGHTPGSYVLYFDGVLIAGDSIQISDGRLQFADSTFSVDLQANHHGVAALKQALAGLPIDFVCTGHQGCIRDGRAKLDDLIARAGG